MQMILLLCGIAIAGDMVSSASIPRSAPPCEEAVLLYTGAHNPAGDYDLMRALDLMECTKTNRDSCSGNANWMQQFCPSLFVPSTTPPPRSPSVRIIDGSYLECDVAVLIVTGKHDPSADYNLIQALDFTVCNSTSIQRCSGSTKWMQHICPHLYVPIPEEQTSSPQRNSPVQEEQTSSPQRNSPVQEEQTRSSVLECEGAVQLATSYLSSEVHYDLAQVLSVSVCTETSRQRCSGNANWMQQFCPHLSVPSTTSPPRSSSETIIGGPIDGGVVPGDNRI